MNRPGGHKNSQIGHSFDVLWPLVRNGGVYVIEDLQVGRFKSYGGENINYEDTEGRGVMACVEIKILRRVRAESSRRLHAIDATRARWRGDAGSSQLDRARTAASSPRITK